MDKNMIKHTASHLDHNLSAAQLAFLFERFAERDAFFIETLTFPRELGTVPCGLYGPLMGDPPIAESEMTYGVRGTREWSSRILDLPARDQHEVTVIAGPHEETCARCGGAGSWQSLAIPDPGGPAYYTCSSCGGVGKIKHACVLYTAFGGPLAPQEPGDPGCKDVEASRRFWSEHALAR